MRTKIQLEQIDFIQYIFFQEIKQMKMPWLNFKWNFIRFGRIFR